jgi:hypothetical protein
VTYDHASFPPEPPPPEGVPFLDDLPPEADDVEPEFFMSVPAPDQPALPGFEPLAMPDERWLWLEARLVGLEQRDGAGEISGYEVGCVDLYADTTSGDLGGAYLRVQAFGPDEQARAEDFFTRLTGYAHAKDLATHNLPDLAERAAAQIAAREGREPPGWRGLTPEEYGRYESEFGLIETARPDDSPPDFAHDELLRLAYELGGEVVDLEEPRPAAQALGDIGLAAGDFDPDADRPPFYDAAKNTAYWIGVYQPDPGDREVCVASILSLTRDADTGEYDAQLAPCMVGDWDQAYAASQHLIRIAERRADIERVFEAAEGMAIAADQREAWQHERGVPLEPDTAQDLGEYAADQWEVEL